MTRSRTEHQSSSSQSYANGGSSSKRHRNSFKIKSSKGNRKGMSSGSSNLDDLKKRVDPRMLEGKTAEDFRRPYLDNLKDAKELDEKLTVSRQRMDRLEQKLHEQEMQKMIDHIIAPEIASNRQRDERRSRNGRKKSH